MALLASSSSHRDELFGAVLAAVLPLEVVEEVEERVEGDHARLGRVHARRVAEDGGRRHRVQNLGATISVD